MKNYDPSIFLIELGTLESGDQKQPTFLDISSEKTLSSIYLRKTNRNHHHNNNDQNNNQ